MHTKGFTLIELLVVVAVIALLVAILLPSLSSARGLAMSAACKSNLRQMGLGLQFYADEWNDFLMPLGYDGWGGTAEHLFWWGQRVDDQGNPASYGRVDHSKGFLWPYLKAGERADDVFACPALPRGTYADPFSTPDQITSAYGYNGYYLSPPATPGWRDRIGTKPWQRATTVEGPVLVFSFGDAAIDMGTDLPQVNAYLDPPFLYDGQSTWQKNTNPTTHFRHRRRVNMACVDGHCEDYSVDQGHLADTAGARKHLIGYVGESNHPHYVPTYQSW